MFDPYAKRRAKAAAARAKEMRAVDFALPVDGDVPDVRRPTPRVGGLIDALVADLTRDRSPFYDEVCARWRELFPDVNAKPARWVSGATPRAGGRLFLLVRSAAASFALRPKLPALKKKLATLASAPPRFSVHVEIGG